LRASVEAHVGAPTVKSITAESREKIKTVTYHTMRRDAIKNLRKRNIAPISRRSLGLAPESPHQGCRESSKPIAWRNRQDSICMPATIEH
jgi:hypothetical protein